MKHTETEVLLFTEMMFQKYRNAAAVTREPSVNLMVSEARIVYEILNDYCEVLRNERTNDNL